MGRAPGAAAQPAIPENSRLPGKALPQSGGRGASCRANSRWVPCNPGAPGPSQPQPRPLPDRSVFLGLLASAREVTHTRKHAHTCTLHFVLGHGLSDSDAVGPSALTTTSPIARPPAPPRASPGGAVRAEAPVFRAASTCRRLSFLTCC